MRLSALAAVACASLLSACSPPSSLTDALMFPPGIDIQFHGHAAKLYGHSQCAQGQLSGNSCLIFTPTEPQTSGTIVVGQRAYPVQLKAFRDPHDPRLYRVEDLDGFHILSTTGQHNLYGELDILPAEYIRP